MNKEEFQFFKESLEELWKCYVNIIGISISLLKTEGAAASFSESLAVNFFVKVIGSLLCCFFHYKDDKKSVGEEIKKVKKTLSLIFQKMENEIIKQVREEIEHND